MLSLFDWVTVRLGHLIFGKENIPLVKLISVYIGVLGHWDWQCIGKRCIFTNEPRSEKTGFLHMRKQRRRSASR